MRALNVNPGQPARWHILARESPPCLEPLGLSRSGLDLPQGVAVGDEAEEVEELGIGLVDLVPARVPEVLVRDRVLDLLGPHQSDPEAVDFAVAERGQPLRPLPVGLPVAAVLLHGALVLEVPMLGPLFAGAATSTYLTLSLLQVLLKVVHPLHSSASTPARTCRAC